MRLEFLKKTNHSLRAAGISQLFEDGVDEKIIQSRSGHRSTEALRIYERITADHEKAVSSILSSKEKRDYRKELELQSSSTFNHFSQASIRADPGGIQCYNCHVSIYQAPVNFSKQDEEKEN